MFEKKYVGRLLLLLSCTFNLTACGQKGPLYLPDKPSEVVTRPKSTTTPQADKPTVPPQP
jgi:predicted small lipoprotein YifL